MSSLKERIASAAQDLYLKDGLDGVSMRKVADVVGVSAPSIYRHFRNKDELLSEIVIAGLHILEGYLLPALEAETPLKRLNALIDRYLDFALEQPKYFDFAFLIPTPQSERIPEEMAKHNWATFQMAVEQVAQCMEQGEFRRDDPLSVALTIWAEVHGLVTLFRLSRFGQDENFFRQTFRSSVQRVLDGLKG